ncbi:LacI family DNA-binding transcriptional regulator [Actinomadura algeriensis]|uniref:DNA-binding LacI/PurR family transcriptional regulator n=1 Tax=Actinomadura algeriensis TaxID=1679523 RepID=A0ABR9JTE1_9ACTN|nr:LacI family DNA-binding transcriptional regulator [Actinomadura algeriensis]MBE1533839.1 DNA-binding LacI/PurR family transcriptional regulator [Actinomadura algeriensis]
MADRRPTLEDVAARAGVGRGTASRVINGSARVSERTRAAVLRAVRDLDYVPDAAARALAGGRPGTVALVLAEEPGRRFEQPYLGQLMDGITAAADAAGALVSLHYTRSRGDRATLARRLREPRTDGVLLLSALPREPLAGLLDRAGVPTVAAGRPGGVEPGGAGDAGHVDADNRGGSERAVEYLIGRGRRRIATIAGPPERSAGADRLAGYRRALDGRPESVAFGDFTEPGGTHAMRRLLARWPDLDAVFAASDVMAAGALRELARQGRRVPDDVAVVGFEDTAVRRPTLPMLTTVHQPTERMGRTMVEMLLGSAGPDVRAPVVCDTGLVLRRTA